MSEALAKLLDLKTAWRRVKEDISSRVFLRHPYSVQLIESDLDGWLASCQEALRTGTYAPRSLFVCDIPKGKGLVRPGSHLSYIDRLVYTACVGACFPAIHEILKWSQGIVDFSYRLSNKPKDSDWLRDRFMVAAEPARRMRLFVEGRSPRLSYKTTKHGYWRER